ncbi:hypothetical protein [uncultured Kordia sp.]|uniref:hypothetical protein n=1 Tax=uncultured Kordia sp. TaxID=507699 RepID=UPI002616D9D6|nr:hypothetical protein [uncultured Kordia sp.]
MNVQVTHNTAKNGIEILFSNPVETELIDFLQKLGFKHLFNNSLKWYADYHPAHVNFAYDLQKAIENNTDWKSIDINPSFQISFTNIENLKFCIAEIHIKVDQKIIQHDYIIFENYKRVANVIAERFAYGNFGNIVESITILPRNYKHRAKVLFYRKRIIHSIENVTQLIKFENFNSLHERDIVKLHKHIHYFNVAIDKLTIFKECKDEIPEEIINLLIDELERGKKIIYENQLQVYFSKLTRLYFNCYKKLEIETRDIIEIIFHPLEEFLDTSKEFKTIVTTLDYYDFIIPNVIVPSFGIDIFNKGFVGPQDLYVLKDFYPNFFLFDSKKIDNIEALNALEIYQISQFEEPSRQIKVPDFKIANQWENYGLLLLEQLGFPTDLEYPYVYLYDVHYQISTLKDILPDEYSFNKYHTVIQNYRPLGDLQKGIEIINDQIEYRSENFYTEKHNFENVSFSENNYNEIKNSYTAKIIKKLKNSKSVIELYIEKVSS